MENLDIQIGRVDHGPTISPRCPPGDKPRRSFLDVPDGPRIPYVEAASGPALILVHGALTALDDIWLGPMSALARNFRVVAIDRSGHGESEHVRLSDASPWRQAHIVRDFARALGLSRPVLVGHSFGGAVLHRRRHQ